MNRNKKTQILAIIGLFAIAFSMLSTAILVIFASRNVENVKISDFMQQTQTGTTQTGAVQAEIPAFTGSTTDK